MSFCSNLDLENSNSIFLQDTLTRNDASQYQVWKQNGGLENIIWTNINILTLHCDRDPEWLDPECSNSSFLKGTMAYDDVSSDQI